MENYTFKNYNDLARLPYFELKDERLVLSNKKEIGPIIDIHTHLALAHIFPWQIDLLRDYGRTQYYLPDHAQLNLVTYANKDFTPELLKGLREIVKKQLFAKDGPHKTHNVTHLTREMDDLGIVNAVILPVDLPIISNNAKVYCKAATKEKKLIPFGSVHPFSMAMNKKLNKQIKQGIKGVKVHPMAQSIRPNHRLALKLYKLCGERDIPILWHCGPVGIEPKGGRVRCQVRNYIQGIAMNPKTTFILGHSGALQNKQALKIAKKYPNTYLDLACQSLTCIRKIVNEFDSNRILFGSDWPFYHEALTLAKVLIATEGKEELRQKILYENAKTLLQL